MCQLKSGPGCYVNANDAFPQATQLKHQSAGCKVQVESKKGRPGRAAANYTAAGIEGGQEAGDYHRLSTPAAKLCVAVMTLCLSACVADWSGMAVSAAMSQGCAVVLYACRQQHASGWDADKQARLVSCGWHQQLACPKVALPAPCQAAHAAARALNNCAGAKTRKGGLCMIVMFCNSDTTATTLLLRGRFLVGVQRQHRPEGDHCIIANLCKRQ